MSCAHRVLTRSAQQTQDVGRALGEKAQPGDVILLAGPLGAGKTCLTQGIAAGLDVQGNVRSPTFVLMNRYLGRLALHHLDLYRIGSALEAWDLGLEEQISGGGVCVVEWPDRAPELFPEESLWVELNYATGVEQREIRFSGGPAHLCSTLERVAAEYPADQGGD